MERCVGMTATGNWSTQQLGQFLVVLAACDDERTALQATVEHAADALDAEVAVIVTANGIVAVVGHPAGQVPVPELLAAAAGQRPTMPVPGVGDRPVLRVPLDSPVDGVLCLARSDGTDFRVDDTALVRGMARALALTVRSQRLLAELGERRRLLERLSAVERSLSHRAPLAEVFDAIVAGAADLLDAEFVGLRMLDTYDPGYIVLVASVGVDAETARSLRRVPISEGVGGQAITERRIVVESSYPEASQPISAFVLAGVRGAMAAPIADGDLVIGSIVVASCDEQPYTTAQQEALAAFAEYASLVLTDARAAEHLHWAMRDQLTGLPNRAFMLEQVDGALSRIDHLGGTVGVVAVAIRAFGEINDRLGYEAGDDVLAEIGRRLQRCVGGVGHVGRLTGDVFVAVVEADDELDVAESAALVGAIFDAPVPVRGSVIEVRARLGTAVTANPTTPPQDLVLEAERAARTPATHPYALQGG
jgi:diguanylate cyclase (GGDEF)-like protein